MLGGDLKLPQLESPSPETKSPDSEDPGTQACGCYQESHKACTSDHIGQGLAGQWT